MTPVDIAKQVADSQIDEIKKSEAEDKIQTLDAIKDGIIEKADFEDGGVSRIPYPQLTNLTPVGSTMLPINMASETISVLLKYAKEDNFVEFVKDKLGYTSLTGVKMAFSSEQCDALVMAIKNFEKGKGFILGDMAGIGKGRVCAGIIRYAFTQGLIPIFCTVKPNLFTDIYRDLTDIGGMGIKKGEKILPIPFLMTSDDKKENSVYIKDKDDELVPIHIPLGRLKKNAIYESKKLPKEYNCVFTTYSQFQTMTNVTKMKVGFVNKIAPNSILVIDESHAAGGRSNTYLIFSEFVANVKAVLFSSATWAKNSKAFQLYVQRTSLSTAVPSMEQINKALEVGGENIAEYIASGLAKEGDMVRRERSFGDCSKIPEYVGMRRLGDVYIEEDREGRLTTESQKEVYNLAVGYFLELREFANTYEHRRAVLKAALNKMDELHNGKEVHLMPETFKKMPKSVLRDSRMGDDDVMGIGKGYYEASVKESNSADVKKLAKQDFREWLHRYEGTYALDFTPNRITKYKATYKEMVFLAIKAKAISEMVIDELNSTRNYVNIVDGVVTPQTTPSKPLIAIADTGEAIFNDLMLEEGQLLKNDFSEYIASVFNRLVSNEIKIYKIDEDIFVKPKDRDDDDDKVKYKTESITVLDSFYYDDGISRNSLKTSIDTYNAEMPLSPIDYIRERIEAEKRPQLYYNSDGSPKYGYADSPNFVFSEATKRKSRLIKINDTDWKYVRVDGKDQDGNPKTKPVSALISDFNNGKSDVIILNQSASTGSSAHSSPKEGKDTRIRNMFTIQIERDITIQIQKRGRVNRTGQLNSPIYTYVVTQIPVELRSYLMFRKKLRNLDATTSANQKATAKAVEFEDASGKEIQDIINKYGFECFKTDFLDETDPKKAIYHTIYNGVMGDERGKVDEVEGKLHHFQNFIRELEIYPVSVQSGFFDEMNDVYLEYITGLILKDEFQEELKPVNWRAYLKEQVVAQLNKNETVFNAPLFYTDYYTYETKKIWSWDKVVKKINELADGKTPKEHYDSLIDECTEYFLQKRDEREAYWKDYYSQPDVVAEVPVEPKQADFPNPLDYDAAMVGYRSDKYLFYKKENDEKEVATRTLTRFRELFANFRIDDENKGSMAALDGNIGRFVGYKFGKNPNKFTLANVDLVFCFLSKLPIYYVKASRLLQDTVKQKADTNINISASAFDYYETSYITRQTRGMFSLPNPNTLDYRLRKDEINKTIDRVKAWVHDPNARIARRCLTGNILTAITTAPLIDGITSNSLQRFSMVSGDVNTGVELRYGNLDMPNLRDMELVVELTSKVFDILSTMRLRQNADASPYPNIVFNSNTNGGVIPDKSIACWLRQNNDEKFLTVAILNPSYLKTRPVGTKDRKIENPAFSDTYFLEKWNAQSNQVGGRDIWKDVAPAVNGRVWWSPFDRNEQWWCQVKTISIPFFKADVDSFFADFNARFPKVFLGFGGSTTLDEFNIPAQTDMPPESNTAMGFVFPVMDYEYIFTASADDEFKKTLVLPYFVRYTYEGVNGGAITSQPISPPQLLGYRLKPVNIPNDVAVKQFFATFTPSDQATINTELTDLVVSGASEIEVGQFVLDKLKIYDAAYFFGTGNRRSIGELFIQKALDGDLMNVEMKEEQAVSRQKQSQITADGADNFIMELL